MSNAVTIVRPEDVMPALKGAVEAERKADEHLAQLVREGTVRVQRGEQSTASEMRAMRDAQNAHGAASAKLGELKREAKPAAGRMWLEQNAEALATMAIAWAKDLEKFALVLVPFRESIRAGTYLPTFKIMPQSKLAELDELRTFVTQHGIDIKSLPAATRAWCEVAR